MIFILSTLINLLLIFAVWRLKKEPRNLNQRLVVERHVQKINKGYLNKYLISAKIAEKTADRAFNLASSANLGVIALQKALVVPRLMTKTQATQNQLAKKTIDELFSGNDDILDYLRPVATDDELDVIDKIQDDKRRAEMNGEHKA